MAGYFTEYSGFKFALFFLGEYLGHAYRSRGLPSRCFWVDGARHFLSWMLVPSWAVVLWEAFLRRLHFFIWLRGTLPRLRQDQLMNFAWKFMLPLAMLKPGGGRGVAVYGRGLGAVDCERAWCCWARMLCWDGC